MKLKKEASIASNNEKILFIYFFQPFAQYRNPLTFYYAQSYPLPPKTTIVGFLQNITRRYFDESFWELKVSIHGGFESRFWNFQQLIGTKSLFFAQYGNRMYLHADFDGRKSPLYGIQTRLIAKAYRSGATRQEELFNGHIFMFIRGDAELLEEIYNALRSPPQVLRLGRSEDVVFVRDLRWMPDSDATAEIREVKQSIELIFPTYIRLSDKLRLKERSLRRFATFTIPVRQKFYILKTTRKRAKDYLETPAQSLSELFSYRFEARRRDIDFETVIWTGFNAVLEFEEPTNVLFVRIKNRTTGDILRFRIVEDYGWL